MGNVLVFKPRIRWMIILWVVLLVLIGYDIVEYYIATDGDMKFKRVLLLVFCVAMIWTSLDDCRRRWVVCDGNLEEWLGKKQQKIYSIERMAWVSVRRAGYWRDVAPWRTPLVEIGFKDRSQTKSMSPLTVEVKYYDVLIETLKSINPDIEVR